MDTFLIIVVLLVFKNRLLYKSAWSKIAVLEQLSLKFGFHFKNINVGTRNWFEYFFHNLLHRKGFFIQHQPFMFILQIMAR